ncbi:MAG: PIG-L deacetylase family protein [Acidimicrobiia bacterium]
MRVPRTVARAVARLKPMVPAGLWPFLLTVRSFAGDGPTMGLPAFGRVLVVSPHPDDESLGCAGTMARLARAGAVMRVVVATDGDATRGSAASGEETARLRRGEVTAAAALLGAQVAFLGLTDGSLAGSTGDLVDGLARQLHQFRPEVVFAPWLLDGHPDHRAVAAALATALAGDDGDSRPEVWGYETWTALVPNRLVDVTATIEDKRRALALHRTAGLAIDLSASIGLNRWRSLHGLMGEGYAEAFLALPAETYLALADELARPAPAN